MVSPKTFFTWIDLNLLLHIVTAGPAVRVLIKLTGGANLQRKLWSLLLNFYHTKLTERPTIKAGRDPACQVNVQTNDFFSIHIGHGVRISNCLVVPNHVLKLAIKPGGNTIKIATGKSAKIVNWSL